MRSYPVYATGVVMVIFAIVTEALVLLRRDGIYPWRDASLSICMTIGHYGTQAVAQGPRPRSACRGLSGVFLFYLPVVWIGFDSVWVYTMVSANAAYQFFVHTELVPHVRWLEWLIDTPSSHRVHHASNPEYIAGISAAR